MPNKHFWAGCSIVAIWMAVLFVGIYGADLTTETASGDVTSVPVVWGIALFATIATIFVAWRGFRDDP